MRLFVLRLAFVLSAACCHLPVVADDLVFEEGAASDEDDAAHHLLLHQHINDKKELFSALTDDEIAHAASSRKGEKIGEAMALLAPAMKYGCPLLMGILWVSVGVGTGGAGWLPLVFVTPVVMAISSKISHMLLRIPELALEGDARVAYQQTLQQKGYDKIPSLPFENTIVQVGKNLRDRWRRLSAWTENLVGWNRH